MSKGKLQKFAEMETFSNVYQFPYSTLKDTEFAMRGRWREDCFHNQSPIVLELGCGKGEYTVGLAKLYPNVNFIGVDIKGARMHTGAKQALDEGLPNAAFLRTNIEIIDRFFAPGEVQEIWLTFSDPQMKNPHKRLTSTFFMERYRRFLADGGVVHLKTDSNFLFTYTTYMVERNRLPPLHTDLLRGAMDRPRAKHTLHEVPPAPRRHARRARRGNTARRVPQLQAQQAQRACHKQISTGRAFPFRFFSPQRSLQPCRHSPLQPFSPLLGIARKPD